MGGEAVTFDPTRPAQTRDGRRVEILRTGVKAQNPIAAIVTSWDGSEDVVTYTADGHFDLQQGTTCWDLVNLPSEGARA
jgi:hypothetical protein